MTAGACGPDARPILSTAGLDRENVVAAHATLAVFRAVLTTVLGTLYQLATMFTQTELDELDRPIQRFETVAYPFGVAVLEVNRKVAPSKPGCDGRGGLDTEREYVTKATLP